MSGGGRTCAVPGCYHNEGKLRKWRETRCIIHPNLLGKDCPCLEPFKFFPFPKQEKALPWVKAINRSNFQPTKHSRVCSVHFYEGKPTEEYPDPSVNLGYNIQVMKIERTLTGRTPSVLHVPSIKYPMIIQELSQVQTEDDGQVDLGPNNSLFENAEQKHIPNGYVHDRDQRLVHTIEGLDVKSEMLETPEKNASLCCIQCSHRTVWPFQLEHHVQRKHRNVNAGELFHAVTEPEGYLCLCCNSNSYYKLGQYEHCIITDKSQPHEKFQMWQCDSCMYRAHSRLFLCKHRDSCEVVTRKREIIWMNCDDGIDGFSCAKCSYRARTKSRLSCHMLTHAAENEIDWSDCTECSYRGKTKLHLKRHMLVHATGDEISWFSCTECSYRTKRKSSLKRHMLTHAAGADECRWFSCAKCSYRALRKSYVECHMRTHAAADEIDWFGCAKCSYRAKTRGNLKQHMLTHAAADEISWFSCTECPYRSKQKSTMNRHMLNHAAGDSKIGWYGCDGCSYRTRSKNRLKNHMLIHATAGESTGSAGRNVLTALEENRN